MRFTVILFNAFLFSACSIKYNVTNKNYSRPIESNVFSYKKSNFYLNNSIIDTTKIYFNAYPVDTPKYFDCYRFFANGKLLSYRFFGKIDTAAFADINVSDVGYYHIKGNEIWTQEFTVFAEHFKEGGGGKLIHYFGTIQNENIKIDPERKFTKRYNFQPKFGARVYYMNYKKTDIQAPKLVPNW